MKKQNFYNILEDLARKNSPMINFQEVSLFEYGKIAGRSQGFSQLIYDLKIADLLSEKEFNELISLVDNKEIGKYEDNEEELSVNSSDRYNNY